MARRSAARSQPELRTHHAPWRRPAGRTRVARGQRPGSPPRRTLPRSALGAAGTARTRGPDPDPDGESDCDRDSESTTATATASADCRPPRPRRLRLHRTVRSRSPTTAAAVASPPPPTRTAASCTPSSPCSVAAPRTPCSTTTTAPGPGPGNRSISRAATGRFRILAIDATGSGAWLLGAAADGGPDPLPAGRRALGAASADAARGRARAARRARQSLTVARTASGSTSRCRGRRTPPSSAPPTAPRPPGATTACDHLFGARFSRGQGYRSIAFAGGGRVISNPLPPSGNDEDNRGTYLVRRANDFVRMPGGGGSFRPSAAFLSPTEGWLEGPVQVTTESPPDRLQAWPVAARAPLTAAVTAPGQPNGSLDAAALAVGQEGGVLRYTPGAGWTREFLLSSSGAVSKPLLRGVAWPEPARAHAVGDLGAMWLWRAETGLWERDPAAPIGFEGNLMGIAFQPGDPLRGYAVGKEGVLLRYDKTWTQEPLPDGFADAHFTAIAFAGSQAHRRGRRRPARQRRRRVAGRRGRPAPVRDAAGCRAAILDGRRPARRRRGRGRAGFVIERDGPDRALALLRTAAARRHPGRARRVPRRRRRPRARRGPARSSRIRSRTCCPRPRPDSPPPLVPPFPLPADGYLVRETDTGWRDEQRAAYAGSTARPARSSRTRSARCSSTRAGEGWALGGWSGESDAAGRGNGNRSGQGRTDRARVQTAAVLRYATGPQPAQPPALTRTGTDMTGDVARFAIAGHAAVRGGLRRPARRGDRPRSDAARGEGARRRALGPARRAAHAPLHGRPARSPDQTLDAREAARYAELLQAGAPAYAAASAADTGGRDRRACSAGRSRVRPPRSARLPRRRASRRSQARRRRVPGRARTTRSTRRAPAGRCG